MTIASSDAACLELRGLNLEIEGRTLVSNISVRLQRGRIAGISGPSGVGKSTFLRYLVDLKNNIQEANDTINIAPLQWDFVAQHDSMFPWYSLRRTMKAFGLDVVGNDLPSSLLELGDAFGIGQLLDTGFAAMSGGERQRATVFLSMALKPQLTLVDEPFSALDIPLKLKASIALRKHLEMNGIGSIIVSHDIDVLCALCDEIWLFDASRGVDYFELPRLPELTVDAFLSARSNGMYQCAVDRISCSSDPR